jgi:hypothetical protein
MKILYVQNTMSKTRTKIQNSIVASKIHIDYENIDSTKKQMEKQLSQKELPIIQEPNYNEPTIYHMESLYRDNTFDKYELINK